LSKPLIVHVVCTFGGGGAEREVARVSQILSERSPYNVIVCSVMGGGNYAESLRKAGVKMEVLNDSKKDFLTMASKLFRFLKKHRPAVVHVHDLRWGTTVARLAGVPVVVASVHYLDQVPKRSRYGVIYDNFHMLFADRIVAVAEAVRQARIKKWGNPGSKITTIPNAVDVGCRLDPAQIEAKKDELGLPHNAPLVGSIANLLPIKGQSYLVIAAAEVIKSLPECRFLIAGDGPCREALEQQINDLGIADNFHLLGYRNDAREIMQVLDVFCLSSIAEAMPITILEAMAFGKPVVTTDVGGCSELVVNGETGLVVPACDPSSLARALLEILNDPDAAGCMGSAGFDRLNIEYSIEANLDKHLSLYAELLSAKGIA
jgi:glycosyltransferase involved in cell wall biosynthesis